MDADNLSNQSDQTPKDMQPGPEDRVVRPELETEKLPLGVGPIIGDSFHILINNAVLVVLVGFVPVLLGELVKYVVFAIGPLQGLEAGWRFGSNMTFSLSASGVVDMIAYAVSTALLVQLAYDAQVFRPIRIRRYLESSMNSILPLTLLSLAILTLFFAGSVLLIVVAGSIGITPLLTAPLLILPLLWLCAAVCVTAPAVVIERAGFRGLARSLSLTKGYRWPIVGTIVLATIVIGILVTMALVLISFFAAIGGASGIVGFILAFVVSVAASTLATGLFSILFTLIYARLRAIKDGLSLREIAEIFG